MTSECPRRPFHLIFLANIIFLAVATCCSGSSQDIHSFLLNWTRAGNDVLFVCCGGAWDPHDIKWQKRVAVRGTRWCRNSGIKALIEQNAVRGARTLFVMYRHRGSPGDCVDATAKYCGFFYSVKLMVIGHFDACPSSATPFPSHLENLCSCGVSIRLRKHQTAIKGPELYAVFEDAGTDHHLRYRPEEQSPRGLLSFSGQKVAVGCRVSTALALSCTACNDYRSKMYLEGLTRLNATVVKIPLSLSDGLEHFLVKKIDVFMFKLAMKIEYLTYFDVGLVSDDKHTTFYVKKSGTKPVNARHILEESKLTLYFLTLCLLLCFVVLVLADLVAATTSAVTVAYDIVLFLVATFYSTSCDMPATVRCCASRRLVILAWVLGSFSLSVYFKGQLTSWLIGRTPEYIVDDPIKLETALDANAILPCVSENTHAYLRIMGNGSVLLGKIKKSLVSQTKETVRKTVFECLQCATKKSRFCVIMSQPECYMKSVHPGLIESKEPIIVAYAAVHVRKHYNLKMAFRSLSLSIFETDWLHMGDVHCLAVRKKLIIEPTPEFVNLHAVAQFMLPCLGVSVAVFLLEVFLGRYFIQRAGRLTGARVV